MLLICGMIAGSHENPELIWNDDAREKVCDTVKKLRKTYVWLNTYFLYAYPTSGKMRECWFQACMKLFTGYHLIWLSELDICCW